MKSISSLTAVRYRLLNSLAGARGSFPCSNLPSIGPGPTHTRCNVSIPARLESMLKPPDYCTSDLRVPDSGLGPLGPLGPPHFGSGNLGSITHVVHEAYRTYTVVVRSLYSLLPPNECDRGCASTPACRRTLSARTSEVAPSVASVVLLHRRDLHGSIQ